MSPFMEQVEAEIVRRKEDGKTSDDDAVLAVLNAVSLTHGVRADFADASLTMAIAGEGRALSVGWDSNFNGSEFTVGGEGE